MKNQIKSIVYTYSFWVVLTLHIILHIYLPLFWLFLFSFSYHKFVTFSHYMHNFPTQKNVISLFLSLSPNFVVGYFHFSWISTLDWWIFVLFRTLILVVYN